MGSLGCPSSYLLPLAGNGAGPGLHSKVLDILKTELPWPWPWLCRALCGFGQLPSPPPPRPHPGAQGLVSLQSKNAPHSQGEYDVYSTFQSHEPEFDYLKSLEIEEKINKIKWLPQQNAAHSLLSTNGEAAGPV